MIYYYIIIYYIIYQKLSSYNDMIYDMIKDIPWEREDVCTICRGTELSGKSLLCDNCDDKETHYHCLRYPIVKEPRGKWFCDICCDVLGYAPGTILDYPKSRSSSSSSIHVAS